MPCIAELARNHPAVIFVNGAAGSGRTERVLPKMRSLVASKHWPVQFRVTQDAEDFKKGVYQAIESGTSVLLAMGGDGTFHLLINAVMNAGAGARVILGVIPAGGGNDFAASLGMRWRWKK
jgi:diacylglycerol kinase (ATP)